MCGYFGAYEVVRWRRGGAGEIWKLAAGRSLNIFLVYYFFGLQFIRFIYFWVYLFSALDISFLLIFWFILFQVQGRVYALVRWRSSLFNIAPELQRYDIVHGDVRGWVLVAPVCGSRAEL